jgi:hypothetical protein
MAFSHTVTRTVVGSVTITKSNVYSADGQLARNIAVPDSTTDMLVALTLDIDQIKAIYMVSDQALTVETNTTGGIDTINLLADKPLLWQNDSYFANPFSTDVTALYLTNASGSAATFQLEVVFDSTV